ncbi:MAG: TolC family protein [Gammaproteobacteria bacterium]|nr:TolC family protein [Gammaproteobacteria bacterium]MDE0511780.1 TolC family protein [Gammaproteobacteria bacterium]
MLYLFRPTRRKTLSGLIATWVALGSFNITPVAADASELTLAQAEQLAQERDAMELSINAKAEALRHQSVADGQLSDPRFKLGAVNFPVDSFTRGQEAMTQLQFGVQQTFPRGHTLRYSRNRTSALAGVENARAAERSLSVLRSVRKAYLELYFQLQNEKILAEHERLFTRLLDITQRQYAVGRDNQHDVLLAQLELSLLQDRRAENSGLKEAAVAQLAKWVGAQYTGRPLPDRQPVLPALPTLDEIIADLYRHPLILAHDHMIDASRYQVSIAEEQYKPGWTVDVTYSERTGSDLQESGRDDFLSAMVLVDVPLFTRQRQDKRVLAGQQRHLAAKFARTDELRELARQAGRIYASWKQLGERYSLYEAHTIIEAQQNAETTLKAYQNDVADFTTLMRARLLELNTRLSMLRLYVERAKVQSDLLYFVGDAR